MGLDVETFDVVIQSGFVQLWDTTPIPRPDAPDVAATCLTHQFLDASSALGLLLHWLNSTVSDTSLMEIFTLIPSTIHCYVCFALSLLLTTLHSMSAAKIQWLLGEEFQKHNDLILKQHPLLQGAFGTMDRLNLPVQESHDTEIENATFNGWLHDYFVSSVFTFGASGEIIACNLNAPGSWHDSRVTQPIYEKLRTETLEGYYLITDTAFPHDTDQIHGCIHAPMKKGTRLPGNALERAEMLAFDRQLLSLRQAAEWGNHALQGSFGRPYIPLQISYHDCRGDLLEICVCLYQLRTWLVGINQI
ncbi:uncharacterized protein ARMOST_00587 [Armillaria ostoyae]|uniref:DDE Tnp4 domain-containing protein n=1 Tax=Armillaria ostoyae TaxID=47428 RepID=A0A284QLJ4_ARMOS|nr:uncharacterized protein ARMOST_00587 [Armillaria ostoyae]